MRHLKSLLLGIAPLVAVGFSAPALALIDPPSASICTSPTVPTNPGDIHAFPGRWWNPQRMGIGWDLFYGDGQRSMYLTLFTYDKNGKPVWFHGQAANTVFSAVTGESTWQSDLYQVKWRTDMVRDRQKVGSVSITFPRQTTTRAAVNWQFDNPSNPWSQDNLEHEECIIDFLRDEMNALPQSEGAPLNQSYSSNWFLDVDSEDPRVGWGVDLLITLDNLHKYSETATVAIYDTANLPVWLQSTDVYGTSPPPSDTLTGTGTPSDSGRGVLRYFTHRVGSVPPMLDDCGQDSCITITDVGGQPATNRFRRNITGPRNGLMSIKVNVPVSSSTPNPNAILWPPPTNVTYPVVDPSPVSHFDADHVIVDKSVCRVTAPANSCNFQVSWISMDQRAIVRRVNLDTNAQQQVGAGMSGEVTDAIQVGERIQYRISFTGSAGYEERSTPEVRTLLNSVVADANVEPADCVTGPGCDLGPHDETAGTMPGEASTEGGAAVYTFPLTLPPGRNGMQPSVSLSYNSRSGNGIAGVGTNLSASSAIHRCPRTVEQDQRVAAVRLKGDDALCLDGQRLVLLTAKDGAPSASQTTGYGVAGAIYRTEIDNFARVTQYGGDLSGNGACFRVEQKDGRIMHYGADTGAGACATSSRNARVVPAGLVDASGSSTQITLSWLLDKVDDRVGNNQIYTYTDFGSGELLLTEIAYTGTGSVKGTRRVTFSMVPKPQSERSSNYVAGGLMMQTQRLDRIDTWNSSKTGLEHLQGYKLSYSDPFLGGQTSTYSGRSLLMSVQQCGYSGTSEQCLSPTTLFWSHATPDNITRPFAIDDVLTAGTYSDLRVWTIGDLDGDGLREVLVRAKQSNVVRSWLVKQSRDRTAVAKQDVTSLPNLADGLIGVDRLTGDFDGDGRTDILAFNANQHLVAYTWNGARGAPLGSPATMFNATELNVPHGFVVSTSDVNGDGRPDLLLRRPTKHCTDYTHTELPLPNSSLCLFLNTSTRVGATTTINFTFNKSVADWVIQTDHGDIGSPGDFNGDGVGDIVLTEASGESSPVTKVLLSHAPNTPATPGCVVDFASDYFQSCSTTALNLYQDGGYAAAEAGRYWVDVNGDGLTDLLFATPYGFGCANGKNPLTGIDSSGTQPTEATEPPFGSRGNWCIKLSTGTKFTDVIAVTGNTDALLMQSNRGDGTVTGGVKRLLRYANRLPVLDLDSDGRANLLYPVALAARHCEAVRVSYVSEEDPGSCPYTGSGSGNGLEAINSHSCSNMAWMCADDPRKAIVGSSQFTLPSVVNLPTVVDPGTQEVGVDNLYSPIVKKAAYAQFDKSAYVMAGLRFEQTGPLSFVATTIDLDRSATMTSGDAAAHRVVMTLPGEYGYGQPIDDMYGDGLVDVVTQVGCDRIGANPDFCQYVQMPHGPSTVALKPPSTDSLAPKVDVQVSTLKNGLQTWINENVGVAENAGSSPSLPDMLLSVTNGLGARSSWSYLPLSSNGFRSASQIKLYSIAPDETSYTDARHFYFNSSMPVVSTMTQHNGLGGVLGFRSWMYGYTEAMFNNAGRGFQGFRTITQQQIPQGGDVGRVQRIVSTFHQKFPLTGRVERVESGVPSGTVGVTPVTRETYTWACNVTNSAACDIATGAAPANYPFLLEKKTETFDLAQAEAGSSSLVSTVLERNHGAGSTAGWDPFGNATYQEVESKDAYVSSAITRVESTYYPNDIGAWWVNKLQHSTRTILPVVYSSVHPMPQGAATPEQSVKTTTAWNADRTITSIATQGYLGGVSGGDDQNLKTYYSYPSPNYGLPTLVETQVKHVDATALPVATQSRFVRTLYTSDGYFPAQIKYPSAVSGGTDSGYVKGGSSIDTRIRDGQPNSISDDATGITTISAYDYNGRLVQLDSFYGEGGVSKRVAQPVKVAWQKCSAGVCPGVGTGGRNSATLNADRNAVYRVTTVQNGSPTNVVFYDVLGREVKRATRGFDTQFVAILTDYDAMGQVARTSVPFKLTSATTSSPYGTSITYDRAGRPTTKTAPGAELDPTHGDRVTEYSYDGLRTNIAVHASNVSCFAGSTDSLCMRMWSDTSALGLVATKDASVVLTDSLSGVTKYWYDAGRRPVAIADVNSVVDARTNGGVVRSGRASVATYNAMGHRTAIQDPNSGSWSTTYNALGELRTQTDARNLTTTVNLRDQLGRITKQTSFNPPTSGTPNDTVIDNWSYDPLRGNLLLASRNIKGMDRWSEAYDYDSASRPTKVTATINVDAANQLPLVLATEFYYDANFGREKAIKYPSEFRVQTIYAKNGEVLDVLDADTGRRLWGVSSEDAWGNVTGQTYGNNMVGQYTVSASTGHSLSRAWKPQTAPSLQDSISYAYDSFGNLVSQTRNTPGEANVVASETYTYDQLQRLVQAAPSTGTPVNYGYDALGNFKFKSDFSTASDTAFKYSATRATANNCGPNVAYQVARASGNASYTCDNNGNILKSTNSGAYIGDRDVVYDANNRPISVKTNSGYTLFTYTPTGERYDTQLSSAPGGLTAKRIIAGVRGYEEESMASSGVAPIQRHDLGEVIVTFGPNQFNEVSYRQTDRLGSPLGVTNDQRTYDQSQWGLGTKKALLTFDAFGMPKERDFVSRPNVSLDLGMTRDGFTGHEHLKSPGTAPNPEIIHMNGRAYDFRLGRFLSVDPLIQFPTNSQSLNPYSYILNNPLAGVDPSGFEMECERAGSVCEMTNAKSTLEIRRSSDGTYFAVAKDAQGNMIKVDAIVTSRENGSVDAKVLGQGLLSGIAAGDPAAIGALKGQGFTASSTIVGSNYMNYLAGNFFGNFAERSAIGAGCMFLQAACMAYGNASAYEKLYDGDYNGALTEGLMVAGGGILSRFGGKTVASEARAGRAAEKGACCCFPAGTPVWTENGPVPIEEIEVGQLVYSRDPETGITALKPVIGLIHTKPKRLYELTIRAQDGHEEKMQVTGDHPYWVKDHGWVIVEKLQSGMVFNDLDKNDLLLEGVELSERIDATYNFTVADFHSYFAGDQKIFVHNSCACAAGAADDAVEAPVQTFKDYSQARNAALKWLERRGFKAETVKLGKFGPNTGKPVGMQTANSKVGFRVEFDSRSGAHINVWNGKEKGPHFLFEGDEALINRLVKQFEKQ